MSPHHPRATLFPYTTLFRSRRWADPKWIARVQRRNGIQGKSEDRRTAQVAWRAAALRGDRALVSALLALPQSGDLPRHRTVDRKSTRLNSSHVSISYAVFCL